jgi:cytochrome c oxidase subunit II
MIAPALQAPTYSRRRKLALSIALCTALVLMAAPAPAFALSYLTPESAGGSPNSSDIHTLYTITLAIAAVIFVGVESALIYSLVKYRKRRGGPQPTQARGHHTLEVSWTVGAAVVVLFLAALTFAFLGPIQNPTKSSPTGFQASSPVQLASINQPPPPGGPPPLTVHVNGQQFLWRYDYPTMPQPLFNYYEMVVPVNTTVVLDITSQDVDHSWWIPQLGGKADAVPGHVNHTWFNITKPGVYPGTCAELCGQGHADMRAVVRAVPVDQFQAWAAQQSHNIQTAQAGLSQQRQSGQGPP